MQVRARETTLEVEMHGDERGEPLVLVMGLGMQLTAWRIGLVERFVQRGFRVIRFDNRDAGLSQRFEHLGTPGMLMLALRHALHMRERAPYSLSDMARDTVNLMDALGVSSAHLCGASMGGMVLQQLAAQWPQRVRSLALMMTSSGARRLPGPTLKARAALLARPGAGEEGLVDHYVNLFRVIGSPAYPTHEAVLRPLLRESLRRGGPGGSGTARQLAAIAADGDRTSLLHTLSMPTVVIHGRADPLVPIECGEQLARHLPHARTDWIEGMGHDLPEALWPRFVDAVAMTAGRV